MKTDLTKGFRDIEDASIRDAIKCIIASTYNLFGFKPVETPIIESEEFVRGENPRDVVISEIFKLQDKGKRNLALRYELTFQLKRLAKNKKLPYKIYQIGPIFRDEPITGNRWKSFTQCDCDIIGADIKNIAEILKASSEILNKLKIKFTINLNNRKLLNEIFDSIKVTENKEQVIRELDKLDKLSEKEVLTNLKKYNAGEILTIFKKPEEFFEKYDSYKDIKELKKICKIYKIKVNFSPFLARGLSYYNWIIFEIKSPNIKETIAGGGSYLINGVQSSGISFGLDRLELLAKLGISNKKVLIISLNQDKNSILLAQKIRTFNVPCEIYYGKPGKALDYANSSNIPLVIFLGSEEEKKKKIKIKNMNTGKESFITESGLEKYLRKLE